ncbi:hypothetical protein L6452_38446 [Arctium lappa]|uniref:Uncharacterized protein n=1 Tax=Arctium lappa TaxID=4217 RepID=A0ACB8XRA6_ARCLA|nr:hypothetical protein L6452_38446 [Arctium lappa]
MVAMEMLNYGRTLLIVCKNEEICVLEVESGKMMSGFCEKIGGVSGVVVERGGSGFRRGECGGYCGGKELGKPVTEMEEVLKVVVEDRRRTITISSSLDWTCKMWTRESERERATITKRRGKNQSPVD